MSPPAMFLGNHLVLWIETLRPHESPPLEYVELCDGIFLNHVMRQIDVGSSCDNIIQPADDSNARQHNLDILVTNIRAYYNEVLQQLILLKMPYVKVIVKDPDKAPQFCHMERLLLLILGCAVQSESKEYFIEKIKLLPVDTQHALVTSIQQITDEGVSVLPLSPPQHIDMAYMDKVYDVLFRLLNERDESIQEAAELAQERDFYQSQVAVVAETSAASPTQASVTPEKHHLTVELADTKAKLRRVRQELEDKVEVMSDLKDELDEHKQAANKLRSDNLELVQEARAARTYRDELDMVKEKVSKVERYEAEILRYKEQLNELDFFKTRVQELREDNAILAEGKALLEEQLSSCSKRGEAVLELEGTVCKYKQQIEVLAQEREVDKQKLEMLTEEMARLEFEKKNSMNESATLEHELEEAKKRVGGFCSLSSQIEESSNAKVLRLELENQRLQQKMNELNEATSLEKNAVNLELQRENQRLAKKVDDLQQTSSHSMTQLMESEAKQKDSNVQVTKISQAMVAVRETSQRQISELETENEYLNQTIRTLRERSEKTNDLRIKEVEKENKHLHDNVSTLTQQVSTLNYENRQLHKAHDWLKESGDKISDLENENTSLEKENRELHKEVATLKIICDKCEKLEQENNHLDAVYRKMTRTNDMLNSAVLKKDELEKLHIDLTVENERLKRAIESQKNVSAKTLMECENEKGFLSEQLEDRKKKVDSQKCDIARMEQMEIDLLDVDADNKKLQKSAEAMAKQLKKVERDRMELETENENLHKSVESLKVSVKHFETMEKEMADLEVEVTNLTRDKANVEKDNRKLKYLVETKDATLDEATFKLDSLDKEHKILEKVVARSNSMNMKLKTSEKEKKELLQQVIVNKKTVATLRDDLFNEKLKTQQLTNELEKLSHELEGMGISSEKLVLLKNTQDESRYKALENMMEDALKKSMEIKEEKIRALESRLDESMNRNSKLQEDLRSVKHEHEMLKQRHEEEGVSPRKNSSSVHVYHSRHSGPSAATKDILQFKDHLVEVERANATLLAENKSFSSQAHLLHEQIRKLESQNAGMQSQISSAQSQVNAIQSDNAKLQVENTMLQSQYTTLMSQNASLHGQLSGLEVEHERLVGSHEELQSAHSSLSSDHDALQQLHEQLSNEYEALISEHGSLKSVHKTLKTEVKNLRSKLEVFIDGKDDVNKIREVLVQERDHLKLETKSLGNLQMDYNELRDRNDQLGESHDKMVTDYKVLISDHKNVKFEYNKLQLKHSEVQDNLDDNRANLHSTEIEIAKLVKRCEGVEVMNVKVEDDNRQLIYQVQTLLNQNHELLTQALHSKDHFAEEEKAYLEKLADLRRQKEKLEEKIMEQYKMGKWDISPRKKGSFGATLVRKARGLLNKARSRSRPNLSTNKDDGIDSLHINGTKTLPRKFDKIDGRRNSAGSIGSTSHPALKKGLAKSTTALNMTSSMDMGHRVSEIMHNSPQSSPALSKGTPDHMGDSSKNYQMVTSPRNGAVSPLEEVVSLEQFLAESDKSPSSRRKILKSSTNLNISDSGSLDSSSQGVTDTPHGHYQRPPRPQSCMQLMSPQTYFPHTDLNISQLSQIFTPPSNSAMSLHDVSTPLSDSVYGLNTSNNNSNPRSSVDRSHRAVDARGSQAHRGSLSQRQQHERFQSPIGRTASPQLSLNPSLNPEMNDQSKIQRIQKDLILKRPSSAAPYSNRHTPIIDKSQMLAHQLRTKSPGILQSTSVKNRRNAMSSADDDSLLPLTEDQPFIPKPVPVYGDRKGNVIKARSHSVMAERWTAQQNESNKERSQSRSETWSGQANEGVKERSQSVLGASYQHESDYSQFSPSANSRVGISQYSSTPISKVSVSRIIQRQYCSPPDNVTTNTGLKSGNWLRNEERMSSDLNSSNNQFNDAAQNAKMRNDDYYRNSDYSRSDDSMSKSFDAQRSPDISNDMSHMEHRLSRSDHPVYRDPQMSRSQHQMARSEHYGPRSESQTSRSEDQIARSGHQPSRSEHQISSRSEHQMSRSEQQMSSRSEHQMSRSEHQMSKSDQSNSSLTSFNNEQARQKPRPLDRPHSAIPPPQPPPRLSHDTRSPGRSLHSDGRLTGAAPTSPAGVLNAPPDYSAPPRPTSRASATTPMARVLPQTKPSAAKPPATKAEQLGSTSCQNATTRRENSVWRHRSAYK